VGRAVGFWNNNGNRSREIHSAAVGAGGELNNEWDYFCRTVHLIKKVGAKL
jgi:hypothetical protein